MCLDPARTVIEVGDYIRAKDRGYWCIQKILKSRLRVLSFRPYEPRGRPCPHHAGPCWRIARKQGQVVTMSARRPISMRSGPLLFCQGFRKDELRLPNLETVYPSVRAGAT